MLQDKSLQHHWNSLAKIIPEKQDKLQSQSGYEQEYNFKQYKRIWSAYDSNEIPRSLKSKMNRKCLKTSMSNYKWGIHIKNINWHHELDPQKKASFAGEKLWMRVLEGRT